MTAARCCAIFLADELGHAWAWNVFLTSTLDEPCRFTGGNADFNGLCQITEAPRLEAYVDIRTFVR